MVDQVNQLIYNMLVSKDLSNNGFDDIYTWVENLPSIA